MKETLVNLESIISLLKGRVHFRFRPLFAPFEWLSFTSRVRPSFRAGLPSFNVELLFEGKISDLNTFVFIVRDKAARTDCCEKLRINAALDPLLAQWA